MRSKTKTVYFIVVPTVIILALAGWLGWNYYRQASTSKAQPVDTNTTKINSVDYNPPTAGQKTAGEAVKKGIQNSEPPSTNDVAIQEKKGTVSVSRVVQTTNNGVAIVSLRTIVTGYTSGTCMATFSQAGQKSIEQRTDVISNTNYYSCAPVDVPIDSFSSNGTWQVSVILTNAANSSSSNTATGSVQIQK